MSFPGNSGNALTLGVAHLLPGTYEVEFITWELGGGSFAEVFAARGARTVVDSSFELLTPTLFAPAPQLTITRASATEVTVSWTPDGPCQQLQSAPNATGPWTDVIGAVNGGTFVIQPNARFFRIGTQPTTRWASSVLGFSSQWTAAEWSAQQATGRADIYPNYGDYSTSWASLSSDDQREYLELGFNDPAPINAVWVYETFAPGAVDRIFVRNYETGAWVEVWSGTASPVPEVARILAVSFPMTSFPVDAVRIELDSPAVPNWNEIDAVSIHTVLP